MALVRNYGVIWGPGFGPAVRGGDSSAVLIGDVDPVEVFDGGVIADLGNYGLADSADGVFEGLTTGWHGGWFGAGAYSDFLLVEAGSLNDMIGELVILVDVGLRGSSALFSETVLANFTRVSTPRRLKLIRFFRDFSLLTLIFRRRYSRN